MRTYKEFPKQAIVAAMRKRDRDRERVHISGKTVSPAPAPVPFVPTKGPSIFDFEKWPQWWTAGAKELEKTAPGQIITAPIRLPAAVVTSTTKTVEEVPGVVKRVSGSVPVIAGVATIIGTGFILWKFGAFEGIKKHAKAATNTILKKD